MPEPATRIAQGATIVWILAVAWSTAIAEIALGVALAALIGAAWRGELRPWRALPRWPRVALLIWAGFAGWVLLTHFFGLDRPAALASLPKMYRFCGLIPLTLLPWDRHFRIALYTALAALAVALAVEALPPYIQGRVGRVEAARLHYNTLAQFAAAISLLLGSAALGEVRVRRSLRVAWGAAAILAVAILVCTLSRMAWAAWLSAIPVMGLLAVSPRRRWVFIAVAFFVTAAALSLAPVRQRVMRSTQLDDPEFVRRYDMWEMGWQVVRERPLVGVGPSGLGMRYDELKSGMLLEDGRRWVHLHNDPINIAAYHGIPAATLWVAAAGAVYVLLLGWVFAPADRRPPPLAVGAALAIHVFFVCGLLHDTLPIYRKLAWYLMLWGLLIHAISRPTLEELRS